MLLFSLAAIGVGLLVAVRAPFLAQRQAADFRRWFSRELPNKNLAVHFFRIGGCAFVARSCNPSAWLRLSRIATLYYTW